MKFIDENGNKHDKAFFDGYDIAERTLEGVMIDVEVSDDGTITCSFRPEDYDYLENYNTEKLLKIAQEHVQDLIDDNMYEMLIAPGDASISSVEYDDGSPFWDPNSTPIQSTQGFTVGLKSIKDVFK